MDGHAHLSGHRHRPPQAPRHPGLNRFHDSPVDIFRRAATHVVSSGSFQRKCESLHCHFCLFVRFHLSRSAFPSPWNLGLCLKCRKIYPWGQLLKQQRRAAGGHLPLHLLTGQRTPSCALRTLAVSLSGNISLGIKQRERDAEICVHRAHRVLGVLGREVLVRKSNDCM